ncbi:MAG: hypothetical protein HZC43_10365 [Nitrosomonadales bacterium]|nr:hypothetical protein [Nitrosomonadales bacterium]
MMRHNRYSKQRLAFVCAAALAAPPLAPPALADSLGRLFFTPEQRAEFEQKRARNASGVASSVAPKEGSITEPAEKEEAPPPSVLTVNGIVQKRGGVRTIWINGIPQNAGSSDEHAPESLAVAVPGKAQPVRVKVGQKLLLENTPQRKPAEQKPAKADDEEE